MNGNSLFFSQHCDFCFWWLGVGLSCLLLPLFRIRGFFLFFWGSYAEPSHGRVAVGGLTNSIDEPSHGRGAALLESSWAPHMRHSISHPNNDFEGIRSHNPTKLPCLSPKNKCTRENNSLAGSSPHEEVNRPGTVWHKTFHPYGRMTLHSV